MKKWLLFMMCYGVLTLSVQAQGFSSRRTTTFSVDSLSRAVIAAVDSSATQPANLIPHVRKATTSDKITRSHYYPLLLDLFGTPYQMVSSKKEIKLAENIYKTEGSQGKITIRKTYNSNNEAEITSFLSGKIAITNDNRWAEDRVVSYESQIGKTTYHVGRFIQVGKDVFTIHIELQKSGSKKFWQELKQDLLLTLSNTPVETFTDNFIERNCIFGNDFR